MSHFYCQSSPTNGCLSVFCSNIEFTTFHVFVGWTQSSFKTEGGILQKVKLKKGSVSHGMWFSFNASNQQKKNLRKKAKQQNFALVIMIILEGARWKRIRTFLDLFSATAKKKDVKRCKRFRVYYFQVKFSFIVSIVSDTKTAFASFFCWRECNNSATRCD